MSKDEARSLTNVIQMQFKERTYKNVDIDLPNSLKQCYIEYVKSKVVV